MLDSEARYQPQARSRPQVRSRPQAQSRPQPPCWLSSSLGGNKFGRGLFNREMGPLQRQLHHGEINLLRHTSMLESNFVQVNRRGEAVDIHNEVKMITIAVACRNLLPDQFLVARSVISSRENMPPFQNLLHEYPPPRTFELTRLLPLHFLRITIHNEMKKQLRFKLPTGRAFYLELCSHPDPQEYLFELWVKVINLLHPSSEQPSEILGNTRDPGRPEESQTPQSPSPKPSADTVSIHSLCSFSRGPSPKEGHARSRRTPSPSVRSQYSTEDPIFSPISIQVNTLAPGSSPPMDDVSTEESLERPPSCDDLSPEEQVEPESITPSDRTTPTGRSKSPHRASPRKPSKILSLFRSCSCGRQKRSRRESKGWAQEKRH